METKTKTKIYISGPITGQEDTAKQRFEGVERMILELGHEPVNPIKLNHKENDTWTDCMKTDIKALMDCDAIYMMCGFETSKGCLLELALSIALGIKFLDAKTI